MFIAVSTTGDIVDIEFNAFAAYTGFVSSTWKKSSLLSTYQKTDGTVGVRADGGIEDFIFCPVGAVVSGVAIISSVNGVTPTDAAHLFTLLRSCAV